MLTAVTTLVSGLLAIDNNGERFFLLTRRDTHADFGSRVVAGERQLRLLTDPPSLTFAMLDAAGREVTIAGRIATKAELAQHDQLTDPTVVATDLVEAETIRRRAFEIFESGHGGTALEHWVRAERELLGLLR